MIIVPMAGRSSRFFDAGYKVPKYELDLNGKSVLDWVVGSFSDYFDTEHFLFIVREDFNGADFVRKCLDENHIASYEVVSLEGDTKGQAHTVYLGLEKANSPRTRDGSVLTIFNADSFLTKFTQPAAGEVNAGMLEVFEGDGEHWSFVRPGPANTVLETREKMRISNLCSDGLYFFRDVNTFLETFEEMVEQGGLERGEYYVAPMYNHLIQAGETVTYRVIEEQECIVCGTPAEYEALLD